MPTLPRTFTIKQLGEFLGTEYAETGGLVRCSITLGLMEAAGEAPKTGKGKAASLYTFTDGKLGPALRQLLEDTKNAAKHQEA